MNGTPMAAARFAQERLGVWVALLVDEEQRRTVLEDAPCCRAQCRRRLARSGRTGAEDVAAGASWHARAGLVGGHRDVRLIGGPWPFADDLALRGDVHALARRPLGPWLPQPASGAFVCAELLARSQVRQSPPSADRAGGEHEARDRCHHDQDVRRVRVQRPRIEAGGGDRGEVQVSDRHRGVPAQPPRQQHPGGAGHEDHREVQRRVPQDGSGHCEVPTASRLALSRLGAAARVCSTTSRSVRKLSAGARKPASTAARLTASATSARSQT